MHEAFVCDSVLESKHSIAAIHAYSNKLILVDSQYTLSHYTEDAKRTLQNIKGFCKSKPVKIHAIKETEMLLVLVDSYVSIFSLVTLDLQQRLSTTKGATSFNVWSGVDHSSGIPVLSTQVAVCVKRQVLLFTWLDSEFEGERHFDCPDRAREAEFLTNKTIVVGMTNDFVAIDIITGTVEALALPIGSFGAVSTTMGYLGSRAPKPILTRTKDQMILVRDVQSSFLDAECNILDTRAVTWQSAPEYVGYTYPYMIVVLKTKVEIRNAKSGTQLQTFDIGGIQFLNDGKSLFWATSHNVYRLTPVPYAEQVEQLMSTGQLDEALSLLEALDSVLLDDKAGLVRRTKELQARALLDKEEFDASMDLFSESWSIPSVVVDLLPKLDVRPESATHTEVSEEERTADAAQKVTETVPVNNTKDAYRALSSYLARTRRLMTRFITNPPGADSEEQYFTPWPNPTPLSSEQLESELVIADTALLRIYIMISPGLVGSLVRLPNRCDPEVVKDYLVKEDRWKELVDFYYSKGLHRDALNLTKEHLAISMAIQYLQRLDVHDWTIVKEFAPWVLTASNEEDENSAMDIFTESSREAESYNRADVAQLLISIDASYAIEYLEYLVNVQNDATPQFSENLIKLYIETTRITELKSFLPSVQNTASAARIYNRIPQTEQFYEVKALCLALMKKLDQALSIYVHQIKDPALSEAFATQQSTTFPDAFEILLQLYLSPDNLQVEEALDLLKRHGPRLPADTISQLPSSIPLPRIEAYLTSSLQTTQSEYITSLIESKLRQSRLLAIQSQYLELRNQRVLVTDSKVCAGCHKRLGLSVIAVFPGNRVTHYGCRLTIT